MSDLKVSGVNWKRPRRIFLTAVSLIAVTGGVAFLLTGSRLLLDADGTITREHVSVSAPYDSMIRQVLVRAGDKVRVGQTIAIVESAAIARTLADLSTEKAKLAGQLSRLEGRRRLSRTLLPAAEANAARTKSYLDELNVAKSKGMAIDKTLHEISSLHISAAERYLTLQIEQSTIEAELKDILEAFREITNTYSNLKVIYNGGVLASPVDGYVGSTVGAVGEVLSSNGRVAQVAKIYTGLSFALAYIPESYIFDIEEGEQVGVRVRGQIHQASIERVLPMTEALPPEFQTPNRVRERGQMVRITLQDADKFALDQKVRVTSCFLPSCQDNFATIIKGSVPQLKVLGTQALNGAEIVRDRIAALTGAGIDYSTRILLPDVQRLGRQFAQGVDDLRVTVTAYGQPKFYEAQRYAIETTADVNKALAKIMLALRGPGGHTRPAEQSGVTADVPVLPTRKDDEPFGERAPTGRMGIAASRLSEANAPDHTHRR